MTSKSYYRNIRELVIKFPRNRVYTIEIDRQRARELMAARIPGPICSSPGLRCYHINQPLPPEITTAFSPRELPDIREWWIYLSREYVGMPCRVSKTIPGPDPWSKAGQRTITAESTLMPFRLGLPSVTMTEHLDNYETEEVKLDLHTGKSKVTKHSPFKPSDPNTSGPPQT